MNKDKFLEKLGITSGKWEDNYGTIITGNKLENYICQMWGRYEEDFSNAKRNGNLICAAPDMLIALIDSIRFFFILMDNIKELKKNDPGFYNYVQNIYNEKSKIIEKAIGKKWDEIMKIWEECQEC